LSSSRERQPDGSYAEIAAPINAEARSMIEEAAFAEFEKVTGEHTAR
jgi:DNA-binding cell septation regulator SpoVG